MTIANLRNKTAAPMVSKETKGAKGPSSEWGGNSNRFGADVDLGLLLRFSKDQLDWLGGEGDLWSLVACQWYGLVKWTSNFCWRLGKGICTPSGNIAVAEEKEPLELYLTRIIRSIMTPDNPVCSEEIPAPLDEIQPWILLSIWGPDIWIIRPG